MYRRIFALALAIAGTAAMPAGKAHGQAGAHTDHAAGSHAHMNGADRIAEVGQSAFAVLAEVVRVLMSDPQTDWSRVDLERLRQHLIDMHEVAMNARVTQTPIPGGLRVEVEGSGRTRDAVRRMALAHSAQSDLLPGASVRASQSDNGATLLITAAREGDRQTEARIRGLGFIGLLMLGSHHGPHHLAIARGDMPHH